MSKFKKGDLVTPIRAQVGIEIDEPYAVANESGGDILICSIGGCMWYHESYFKPYTPQSPTKEQVLAAMKEHGNDALKKLFPDYFEPEYFDFGEEFVLNRNSNPIMIGMTAAPHGLNRKCLVVQRSYTAELTTHNGYQILTLKKK